MVINEYRMEIKEEKVPKSFKVARAPSQWIASIHVSRALKIKEKLKFTVFSIAFLKIIRKKDLVIIKSHTFSKSEIRSNKTHKV